MKYLYLLAILMYALSCMAFECLPYGPEADVVYNANFADTPESIVAQNGINSILYLREGVEWQQYPFWATNFPIAGTCLKDANTMMVAMGGYNSYSDGVYDFDLFTHQWSINEWFMSPKFILKCPVNNVFYVGERDGLFQSTNGMNWSRITQIGTGECKSLAYHGQHFVTNRGPFVYYSSDAGISWLQSATGNLQGFRFGESGDVLYAIMAVGSDSDGLWSSTDHGATWTAQLYTSGLSAIGPDFGGRLPLAWSLVNENGYYVELMLPSGELSPLDHPSLNSPVRKMEIFPLVNTPSFYVINDSGLSYVTNFLPVSVEDDVIPAAKPWDVRIYPNPSFREINLSFSDKNSSSLNLFLYDLKGRRVASFTGLMALSGHVKQALPDLPAGIYLLRIEDEHQTDVKKLTIIR